jgi:diguanylate cyclase (GGDEF)-like protein
MENLIVLGLAKAEGRKHKFTNTLASLIDGLLSLLDEQFVQDGISGAEEFRSALRTYREKLSEAGTLDEYTAAACVDECESYFQRARAYVLGRDAEINELIELLRTALIQLTGESNAFHERIFASSDRFKRLSRLEDIRQLKEQIANEVRDLRQTVLEKQQHDEENYAKLSKRILTLQSRLQLAREEALKDPLTHIANRGGFDRAIHSWVDQRKPFVLAMMDVDHFKQINDTHGHRVGDGVLLCAAQWLGENLRNTDFLARFGGDEFAVLLSNTDLKLAERRFTSTLAQLASRSYIYPNGSEKRTVKFTMSCGLAELGSGDTVEKLIQKADEALYEAKKKRNRVCMKRPSVFGSLF